MNSTLWLQLGEHYQNTLDHLLIMKKVNVMKLPENIEQFWQVPSITTENGFEHKFSHYYVHSVSGDLWSAYVGRYKILGRDLNGYRLTVLQSDDGYMLNTTMQRIVLASKLQHWFFEEAHHLNTIVWDNSTKNIEERSRKGQFDEQTRENQSKAKRGAKCYKAILTEQDVRDIRLGALSAPSIGEYKIEMAEKYNVHHHTIYSVIKRYTWTDIKEVNE